jgi:hypothetical protein
VCGWGCGWVWVGVCVCGCEPETDPIASVSEHSVVQLRHRHLGLWYRHMCFLFLLSLLPCLFSLSSLSCLSLVSLSLSCLSLLLPFSLGLGTAGVNNTFPLHHANRGNATINFATGAVATPSYVRFDSDNVQVEWVYDPPSQSVRCIVTVQKLAWLVTVV